MQQVMPPASIDHEFEEMKWGLNMTLIGDGHWKSLVTVDDIKNIVDRMGKKVNFRVSHILINPQHYQFYIHPKTNFKFIDSILAYLL